MPKQNLTTQEVIERLGAKYPSPQYGFLTQVRNGTGFHGDRTADAIAMSLWPSRGLHIFGFEVKVSRTDWMKELKSPEKAESFAAFCHYWYMVFGSEEIFKLEEIPANWGAMVPHGKGFRIVKEAQFNDKVLPIDYLMLAGILRNVAEQCIPRELIKTRLEEAHESGRKSANYDVERFGKENDRMRKVINDFENSSGLKLDSWQGGDQAKEIGKAVKMVLEGHDTVRAAEEAIVKVKERVGKIIKFLDGEAQKYEI